MFYSIGEGNSTKGNNSSEGLHKLCKSRSGKMPSRNPCCKGIRRVKDNCFTSTRKLCLACLMSNQAKCIDRRHKISNLNKPPGIWFSNASAQRVSNTSHGIWRLDGQRVCSKAWQQAGRCYAIVSVVGEIVVIQGHKRSLLLFSPSESQEVLSLRILFTAVGASVF